jgi:hypothetical protein
MTPAEVTRHSESPALPPTSNRPYGPSKFVHHRNSFIAAVMPNSVMARFFGFGNAQDGVEGGAGVAEEFHEKQAHGMCSINTFIR